MGPLRRFSNRIRAGSDRGASGVEYGLVLALLLTGTTASIEMMDERVQENYEETAQDVGQVDLQYFEVTTTACESCETTTTTTTTTTAPPTTTTTTTTAPPTTTTSTTTTTTTSTTTTTTTSTTSTTTTTTTVPATTTTAGPAEEASVEWRDRSRWSNGCGCYRARVRITLHDENDDDLENATVTVRFTLDDGTGQTAEISGTTDDRGRVNFQWSGLSGSDFEVLVEILSITSEDDDPYTPSSDEFWLAV